MVLSSFLRRKFKLGSFKFLLTLAFVLFFMARFVGVGRDISNSDAARWHRRSLHFLQAVKSGDLSSTYQHYQPGVTLMLMNAPLNQAASSFQRHFLHQTPKTLENADFYPVIHALSKGQLALVLGILLVAQVYLISLLFGQKTALIFAFFIALEPYLVGIDRWFHLTSLETYFSFTSFLSLLWWKKSSKRKFLYFSSVFFGLAVLSKLTSLILGPVLLAIFFIDWFDLASPLTFWQRFASGVKFALVFVLTFVLLFPAMWVTPLSVLQKLYEAIFNAVAIDSRSEIFSGLKNLFYYPVILVFKLSPITLFLFIAALFKKKFYKGAFGWVLFAFLNFLVFLTISDKKIDRYAIILFPYVLLLSAGFLASLKFHLMRGFLALWILTSYVLFLVYSPVNSAYYSPLFAGSRGALSLGIYENSGEYFADAAGYLNTLGRENTIWVPHNLEAFSYYYKGGIVRHFNPQVDYAVISLDIDRPSPEFFAPEISENFVLEKTFGDPYTDLVYVFKSSRQ